MMIAHEVSQEDVAAMTPIQMTEEEFVKKQNMAEKDRDDFPTFVMEEKKEASRRSPLIKSDGFRKPRMISNEAVSEFYKDYYNQWILQNIGK